MHSRDKYYPGSHSRAIHQSNYQIGLSSCNSLPIRVRSASWASINLRLKPLIASSACFRSVMSANTERMQSFPPLLINTGGSTRKMMSKTLKTTYCLPWRLAGHFRSWMRHFRTLVVDDVEDCRHYLCSALEQGTACEVVGQASDGLQAVLRAQELQPDLILLDIGLPSLNGIEAARRIRKLSPNSKILFFTQNCSLDIAQGALRTGANGYILKSDATDLPFAVETVLRGEQFVSRRVLRN